MYCLTILEPGGLKSRCPQDRAPFEGCRGILPCLSLASGGLPGILASLASRCTAPCPSAHSAPRVSLWLRGCVLTRPPGVLAQGPGPPPVGPHPNLMRYICKAPVSNCHVQRTPGLDRIHLLFSGRHNSPRQELFFPVIPLVFGLLWWPSLSSFPPHYPHILFSFAAFPF